MVWIVTQPLDRARPGSEKVPLAVTSCHSRITAVVGNIPPPAAQSVVCTISV